MQTTPAVREGQKAAKAHVTSHVNVMQEGMLETERRHLMPASCLLTLRVLPTALPPSLPLQPPLLPSSSLSPLPACRHATYMK